MKSSVIIVIAALTVIVGADKPKSPSAVKAQRTYEDSVRATEKQHRQSLESAQEEYLKQLKEASDAALKAKDLNAANEIEAARKAITKKKSFTSPTYQLAIEAQRMHEDSVQMANEHRLDAVKKAEEVYLLDMQAGLDAAIAAKDLTEANRIDVAMKEMQQVIDARDATEAHSFSTMTNSIGMTFVMIPAGEFMMGSPKSEPGRRDDENLHKVTLTQPIAMGIHEVTQAQYEQVMGRNPSKFKGANNPVERVSWVDAIGFCRVLSALPAEQAAGRVYRLPTEAEWEYSSRAGTSMTYGFGNDQNQLGDYAWFDQNSRKTSHPVGQKKPNAWGLHDIHGNVMEYCSDFYDSDYDGKSPSIDPQGPPSGDTVVSKGGCWFRNGTEARFGLRGFTLPADNRHEFIGFRVVAE